MKYVLPLLHFIFHLGYFGPLVMGVLDSSFLVLPFGNDLVVVGLAAQNHKGIPWYVLSAACGSTCGALLLALVARKRGQEAIREDEEPRRQPFRNRRCARRISASSLSIHNRDRRGCRSEISPLAAAHYQLLFAWHSFHLAIDSGTPIWAPDPERREICAVRVGNGYIHRTLCGCKRLFDHSLAQKAPLAGVEDMGVRTFGFF
jgi:hypothetical protein